MVLFEGKHRLIGSWEGQCGYVLRRLPLWNYPSKRTCTSKDAGPQRRRHEEKKVENTRATLFGHFEAVFASVAAVNKELFSVGKKNLVIPDRLLAGVYGNALSRISEACQVWPSGANGTTPGC